MTNGLEIIRPDASAARARVVLFDFDGTLSLVRAGWEGVMIPMMVEFLAETGSGESEAELTAIVREFVGRLTGRQTIYQMMELRDQVSQRGGTPKDPLEYKHIYLDRLMEKITDRREGLRSGKISADELILPGGRRLLEALVERGLTLYLASGTDQVYMREEAELLDVAKYFNGNVFGALDDYKAFSKKILVEKLIRESGFGGEEFLGFGDGFVEIENVKEVGGVAVGVASDEPDCVKVEPVKRERLIGVGADWIVPNFNAYDDLMAVLFPA
ncbi:MAG: HAD family hydrolase [Acidobacteria bacterium]|nr:HAD family hydrolase [Acidobacteriota bacterium]